MAQRWFCMQGLWACTITEAVLLQHHAGSGCLEASCAADLLALSSISLLIWSVLAFSALLGWIGMGVVTPPLLLPGSYPEDSSGQTLLCRYHPTWIFSHPESERSKFALGLLDLMVWEKVEFYRGAHRSLAWPVSRMRQINILGGSVLRYRLLPWSWGITRPDLQFWDNGHGKSTDKQELKLRVLTGLSSMTGLEI